MSPFAWLAALACLRRSEGWRRRIVEEQRQRGQDKSRKVRAVGWRQDCSDYNAFRDLRPLGPTLRFGSSRCFLSANRTFRAAR